MGQRGSTSCGDGSGGSGTRKGPQQRRRRSGFTTVMEGGDCQRAPPPPRGNGTHHHHHSVSAGRRSAERHFNPSNVPPAPVKCVAGDGGGTSFIARAVGEQRDWLAHEERRRRGSTGSGSGAGRAAAGSFNASYDSKKWHVMLTEASVVAAIQQQKQRKQQKKPSSVGSAAAAAASPAAFGARSGDNGGRRVSSKTGDGAAKMLPEMFHVCDFPSQRTTGVEYFTVAGRCRSGSGSGEEDGASSPATSPNAAMPTAETVDTAAFINGAVRATEFEAPPAGLRELPIGNAYFELLRRAWAAGPTHLSGGAGASTSQSAFGMSTTTAATSTTTTATTTTATLTPATRVVPGDGPQPPMPPAGDASSANTSMTTATTTTTTATSAATPTAAAAGALSDEAVLAATANASSCAFAAPVPLTQMLRVLPPRWAAEGLYTAAEVSIPPAVQRDLAAAKKKKRGEGKGKKSHSPTCKDVGTRRSGK